jgi:type IV fimbrial biogenesis protein FimT
MRHGQRGLTLYELALTLALLAVLGGLALPAFGPLVARSRMHTELDALFHALYLARTEAIMRRRVVSLCPSSDGRSCTPGRDWSSGWILFANRDRDEPPRVDPGEPLLRVHGVAPGIRITANRRGFTVRGTWLRATNGTFVVCDEAGRTPPRALVVSYTGRPRVAAETPRGEPYRCAD